MWAVYETFIEWVVRRWDFTSNSLSFEKEVLVAEGYVHSFENVESAQIYLVPVMSNRKELFKPIGRVLIKKLRNIPLFIMSYISFNWDNYIKYCQIMMCLRKNLNLLDEV